MMYRKLDNIKEIPAKALAFDANINETLLSACDCVYTLWRDTGEFLGLVGLYRWSALLSRPLLWFAPSFALRKQDWRQLKKGVALLREYAPNAEAAVDINNTTNVNFLRHMGMVPDEKKVGFFSWK